MEKGERMNKEIKKVEDSIKKVSGVINKFNKRLDDIYIEEEFDLGIELFGKTEEGKKMTKKQRESFVLDYLEKKYPQLDNQLKEINIITEAISLRINKARDNLEEAEEEVSNIEGEQEELESRIDELKY